MAQTLLELVSVGRSLIPASYSAVVDGIGFTAGRKHNQAVVFISAGAIGGTNPSFTFRIQHSVDDAVYDDVPEGQPTPFTTSNRAHLAVYKGTRQFLRVALTEVAGLTPSLICGADVWAIR